MACGARLSEGGSSQPVRRYVGMAVGVRGAMAEGAGLR